jgi:hypothetical protein
MRFLVGAALGFSTLRGSSIMQTTKLRPSVECAARRSRQLRIAADPELMDVTLGDPPPGAGRSALEQLRSKPPEPAKVFSISAARRGDISREAVVDRELRLRLEGKPKRPKRLPGAAPCRGNGKPRARPPRQPAADAGSEAPPTEGPPAGAAMMPADSPTASSRLQARERAHGRPTRSIDEAGGHRDEEAPRGRKGAPRAPRRGTSWQIAKT